MKIKSKKSFEKEGYYDVFVEDKYICKISEKIYFKYSFYEEKDMTIEEFTQMKWQFDYTEARSRGIKFISRALKTEKETRDKLMMEEFEQSVIDAAIDELKNLKYINDEEYTKKYIRTKLKLKPRAYLVLRNQLLEKGIDENLINQELINCGHNNYDIAMKLVEKKFGEDFYIETTVKNKIISFLKNRSFDFGTIKKIISKFDIYK